MKKFYVFLAGMLCCIFYSMTVMAHDPHKGAGNTPKTIISKKAVVCLSFEKIYEINFHDQEYKIDFWCTLTCPKDSLFDFKNQLQVVESKKTQITLVDSRNSGSDVILLLKLSCVMFHNWDIEGYPFDGQKLPIIIYNAGQDTKQFNFISDDHGLHNTDSIELENGWELHKVDKSIKIDSFSVPFGESNYHSSILFNLDIDRTNRGGLFIKLFVGMYVAFLVAFFALFIDIKKYVEPRFALTVGALFAAIANKYIVESLLPESPFFNLVDRLHALTFLSITAIILLSVISLYLHPDTNSQQRNKKHKLLAWFDRKGWIIIFSIYAIFSVIFIIHALHHGH